MKVTSDVIRDLIPLVKDGVASDDSVALVKHYLRKDEALRVEFEAAGEEWHKDEPIERDEQLVRAIKRGVLSAQISILIIGAWFGIVMTGSFGMFYNILIMPLVGVLAVFSIRSRWHLATPLAVFAAAYVWQAGEYLIKGGYSSPGLSFVAALPYSAIYALLAGVGVIIGLLLKFAFKKES